MTVTYRHPPERCIDPSELPAWAHTPVSIIGDELNRTQIMHSAIRPLATDDRCFAGFALTVSSMVGDNLAAHHALSKARQHDVLVIDARSHEDTAVWGEVMQTAAVYREMAAVIIDGAVRDAAALRKSTVPVYARSICPAGPHKGFGGHINQAIQCGGVAIHSGDLVVGDSDGVVVIRPQQIAGLLKRCRERLAQEETMLTAIRAGTPTIELMGFTPLAESK